MSIYRLKIFFSQQTPVNNYSLPIPEGNSDCGISTKRDLAKDNDVTGLDWKMW